MAGSWPDTPSRKIAYHADGTVVVGRYPADGAPYENFYDWDSGPLGLEEMNDLDFDGIVPDYDGVTARRFPALGTTPTSNLLNKRTETAWIFPEYRDIYGYAVVLEVQFSSIGKGDFWMYISGNTTNGIDGDWTVVGFFQEPNLPVNNNYPEWWRESQVSFFFPRARGMRFLGTGNFNVGASNSFPMAWRAAFLFGMISAGETPDRILFIDNYTGLEFTLPMDWGDVPRGSVLEWDIYLLNNSSTLTANTMTLDMKTLYNVSDTWYQMKVTGGMFGDTIAITSMAPGARFPTGTDIITVRLSVPQDQPLSIYEAFLELSPAASWT